MHDESHSGAQAGQAHRVGSAALILIWEELRLALVFGIAAGAAVLQWLQTGFYALSYVETSCSLGTKQAFVSGESQQIDVHGLHVNGIAPG